MSASREKLCRFSPVISVDVGGGSIRPRPPQGFLARFLLCKQRLESCCRRVRKDPTSLSPVFFSDRRTGWISSAPAEGVWNLTENICTLLWPNNYQQWDWWDYQAPGGSHRACVYSLTVGPGLLGLLDRSWENWKKKKSVITGNHLIHGKPLRYWPCVNRSWPLETT